MTRTTSKKTPHKKRLPKRVKPPKKSFAHVLQALRLKLGLTRAEMADLYKAAGTVITRLESGRGSLSEATIRRYAKALGCVPVLRLVRVKKIKRKGPKR